MFAAARALSVDSRPAYLAEACAGNEALRQEVTGRIAVTVIYPGAVDTELADSIPGEAFRTTMQNALADGALRPEDVAAVILNVLSQPPNVMINEIVVRPANAP